MRGSCSLNGKSSTRVPPISVFSSAMPGCCSTTLPIMRRVAALRRRAHRFEHGVGAIGSDKRHQLAFVRDEQRVDAEHLAGALHRLAHGHRARVDLDADVRCGGDLAQRRAESAARGIAQDVNLAGGKHCRDQAMQRLRVGEDLAFELQAFALREHRHSVVGDRAAQQDDVAGPRVRRGDVHAFRHEADARSRDEQLVGRPAVDDFRVAGDDRDARRRRCGRHRLRPSRESCSIGSPSSRMNAAER